MIYTVQKGEHDFKPNNQVFFTFKSKVSGSFRMDVSMWFSREDPDYSHGEDVKDWNKLAGVTWFFSGNSNRSAMLAWRPVESEKGLFQLAGYVNPLGGGFKAEKIMQVRAGELIDFKVIWSAGMAVFKIRRPGEDWIFAQMPLDDPPWWGRIYRQLGPWFGGNRAAHKRMELILEI